MLSHMCHIYMRSQISFSTKLLLYFFLQSLNLEKSLKQESGLKKYLTPPHFYAFLSQDALAFVSLAWFLISFSSIYI